MNAAHPVGYCQIEHKLAERIYRESAGTRLEGMRCNAAHLVVHKMITVHRGEANNSLILGACGAPDSGRTKVKAYFGATATKLEATAFRLGGNWTKLTIAL